MVEARERKGLLEILSQTGKLSEPDIERARGLQRETGQKDWQILLQLGMLSEEDLRNAQGLYFKLPIWEKKKKVL